MARTDFQRYPSPNSKYPFVGPNYMQYGEVEGYVYYPYNDQYYVDPRKVKEQYEQEGLIERQKEPSLLEDLAPVAGGAIVLGAGQQIGSGLFGVGAGAATGTGTGAAAGAGAGAAVGTGTGAAVGTGAGAAVGTGAAATGGASAGAGAATGTAAGTTGLGSLSVLGPAAAVGAFYGPSYYKYGKTIAEGKAETDDYAKGALLAGGPLTAWAVPIADFMGVKWKSGKHKDQKGRDAMRKHLQGVGLVDDKYQITLADGSKFDIGKDGGFKYDDGMAAYQAPDPSKNPAAGQAIGYANPLATIFSGGDQKLTADFAGYFSRAALQNGNDPETARRNILAMYQKAGIDQAKAFQVINEMEKAGKLDAATANAYRNGINQTFGQEYRGGPAPAAAPGAQGAPQPQQPQAGRPQPNIQPPPRQAAPQPQPPQGQPQTFAKGPPTTKPAVGPSQPIPGQQQIGESINVLGDTIDLSVGQPNGMPLGPLTKEEQAFLSAPGYGPSPLAELAGVSARPSRSTLGQSPAGQQPQPSQQAAPQPTPTNKPGGLIGLGAPPPTVQGPNTQGMQNLMGMMGLGQAGNLQPILGNMSVGLLPQQVQALQQQNPQLIQAMQQGNLQLRRY